MHAATSPQPQFSRPANPHRFKLLPGLGALAFIGVSIYASQAGSRPAGERLTSTPPAGVANQGDKIAAHTAKAIASAEKFLASLDDTKKAKATFEFNSDKRARWTNLPGPRMGTYMGELTKEQQTAAMDVVAAVLSKEGYQKVLNIIAADDVLAKGGGMGGKGDKGDKGGKGGKGDKGSKGGGGGFGFDNYHLAIFGKPSPDQSWLVEFGGHHLAINVTIVGKDFVLTPTLTCAQPSSFTKDGKTIRPLGTEVDTGFKLLNSLNEKQRAQAILKNRTSDLLLGPGKDGKEIPPEGIKGSELNEKQQALLVDLAGAWVTILHETSANPRMADIRAKVKDTYFGWSGPTAEGSAAYFRVQGPSVFVEYAPQGGTDHIHTMVREFWQRLWKETDQALMGGGGRIYSWLLKINASPHFPPGMKAPVQVRDCGEKT